MGTAREKTREPATRKAPSGPAAAPLRAGRGKQRPTSAALRKLIDAAMDLERRTMRLYCAFESRFADREDLRAFWFDMAQHEARHFGGLALVAGLLDSATTRRLPSARTLSPARLAHLRRLITRSEAEAQRGVTVERAFEIALEIESSEIEDVVLDLLHALSGERERARAVSLLIHDLGDLSYMIEKHTRNRALLERADRVLEQQVGRLRADRVHAPRRGPGR